ncbi:MAG: YbaB/EbfC family nucleoid-associated protein [Patescibacteria group bacterium]|nr:YbaB/EbfC family nucleoid-associated protein [Patescibacteria group bacterium]
MFNKLKQVMDLKKKQKEIQSALSNITAEGSAAWGKVKVTMDGNQKALKVQIDDSMLADKAKLEEAVRDAFNDTGDKLKLAMASKMDSVLGPDTAKQLQDIMKG